ncbi:MAG: VCBS repeat-containing protein [Caulobacter sp.]|nr:VCBS repeat-containing protein [Caulobacter sp.]
MADPQLSDVVTSITGEENALNATPAFIDADVTFADADGDLTGAVLTVSGLVSGDRVSLGATGTITLVGGQVFYDADGEGGAAAVAIGTAGGGVDGTFVITFNADATGAGVEAAIEALTFATVSDTPAATRQLVIDVIDSEGHPLYHPVDFATPVTVMTDFGDRAAPFRYLADFPWFGIGNADGTVANWRYQNGAWQQLITQAPFAGMDFGSNVVGTRGEIIRQFGNQVGAEEYIYGLSDGTLVLRGQDNGVWVNGSGYGITGIDVGDDATPTLVDLDGDGDLDLVVGNQAGEIHYFRNEGTTQVPDFVEQTGAANPFDGITIASGGVRPALADMDRDGDLDLVAGAADGRVWYYVNVGDETSPSFQQVYDGDFSSGFDVGTFASPFVLDVDGDGDMDLLVGRGDGTVAYYENTTPRGVTVTVNVTPQDDPIVHSGTPCDVTATEDAASPLDLSAISLSEGDGETVTVTLTVDIGVLSGTSRDGVTVGGSGGATITLTGTAAAIDAFLNSPTNAVGYAAPADAQGDDYAQLTITADDGHGVVQLGTVNIDVADVNDAPVSTVTGGLTAAENTANAGPVLLGLDASVVDLEGNFDGGTVTVGGLLAEDVVSVRDQGDDAGQVGFDSGAGEVSYGGVVIGVATGGQGAPFVITFDADATAASIEAVIENLTYANTSDTPTGSRDLSVRLQDGDGAPDPGFVFVAGVASPVQTPFHYSGRPTLADIDGDGDLDAVVGGGNGELRYLENTGSGFVEHTGGDNPFSGLNAGGYSSIAFADLDADGDLDAWTVSQGAGAARYLRNDGTATAPSFVEATGPENPFAGIDPASLRGTPVLADLDGDGDVDLISASNENYGIAYFENTGSAQAPLFTARGGASFAAFDLSNVETIALGDIDSDGDLDLVFARGNELSFFENTGTTTAPVWTAAGVLPGVGYFAATPALGDLNNDGRVDLLVGDFYPNLSYFWNSTVPPQVITVVVTAENDAPRAANLPATVTATEDAVSGLDLSAVTISDPEGDGLLTITLTVDAGLLSATGGGGVTVDGSGTDTLVLTGLASAIDAFLDAVGAVSYGPEQDVNGTGVATITITGDDGEAQAVLGTVAIDVASVNDAPVLTLNPAVTIGENAANAGPVLLGLDATVVDVEGDFDGGELMVGGLLPEDVVSVRDQGDAAGEVGFDAATGEVSYGGVVIGIATGGEGADFSIIFDADATAAAVQAVIENLTYANASDTPPTTRSLIVELVDGERDTSGPQTVTVNVTPQNDAIETTPLPTSATAVEDQASDLDLSSVTFSDPDGDGQVTFTLSVDAGVLTATSTSFVTVTDSGTGTIILTGLLSEVDAFLKNPSAVRYTGPQDVNGTGAATLSITGNDGGGAVELGTVAIDITPVNDAPVLTLTTNTVTFDESAVNDGPRLLNLGLTATDVEGDWSNGKLSLSLAGGDDQLSVVEGAGITVSGNVVSYNGTVIGQIFATAGAGKDIYFNANTTTAAVNALMGQIGYANPSDAPEGERVLFVTLYDDVANSWSETKLVAIDVTPENDAIEAAGVPATATVTEDMAGAIDLSGVTLSDPDGDGQATITLSVDAGTLAATSGGGVAVAGSGTGTVTLTGLVSDIDAFLNNGSAVAYTGEPNADGTGAATLTITGDDGEQSVSLGEVSIDITAVNDPAELTVTGSPVIDESEANAGPVLLGVDASVVDPEGNFAGGKLIIDGLLPEDAIAIRDEGDGDGQVGFDSATGEVSYGGVVIGIATGGDGEAFEILFDSDATPAAVEAVIENLTYANASDTPTATRDLNIRLLDGATNSVQFTPASADQLLDGLPFYNRSSFAFADIDDDGDLDAFVSDIGGLAYYENTGSGFVVAAANPLSSLAGQFDPVVTFGDLDGDGDLDAIVGTQAGVRYMRNDGTASAPAFVEDTALSAQLNSFPSAFFRPTLLDRDGDGDLDLIIAYGPDGTRYWENTGDSSSPNFVQVGYLGSAPPSGNPGVAAGDFDGDGDIDLVRFDWSGSGLTLFENVDGTWVAKGALPGAPDSWYAVTTTADIDGDGDLDLIVASYSQGVFYHENTSERGQTVTVTVTAENDPIEAAGVPSSHYGMEDWAQAIDLSAVTLSDPDGAPGASVTITLAADGGTLTGFSALGVTVGGSGGATLTLTGTLADIEAFLETGPISYQGPLNANGTGVATVTISADDGHGAVELGQIRIDLSPMPDAPSVDIGAAGVTFTFDENTVNAVGQLILPTATLSDIEGNFSSFPRITLYGLLAEDVIGIRGGGAVAYNASTGEVSYNGVVVAATYADPTPSDFTVAFNASASMSMVQAVLQSLTYSNASDTPTGQRTLTLRVFDDGGLPSSPIGLIINVTPQEDPTTGDDDVSGSPIDDLIDGDAGDDILWGGDGADYLRGGSGADAMHGGAGDDFYAVENSGDVVVEDEDEGIDTVQSRISYILTDNVEHLILGSAGGAANGTGNGLDNTITGNAFVNTLRGLAGDDTLLGAGGNDYLHGGDGEDSLDGGAGVDELYGDAGTDTLIGGLGNDYLDGGADADTMTGGAGNDTYVVDDADDVVIELAGGGTDVVQASASWTMSDQVENLIVMGADPVTIVGNASRNTITGGGGQDTLYGGGDIDTLYGLAGDDRLHGEAGNDILDGGVHDDQLFGGAGIDTLRGGDGDDVLAGEGGADKLYGGTGADRFVFGAQDAASATVERDQIFDLNFAEGDIIDLSAFDANPLLGGDQALTLSTKFTGVAGQVIVSYSAGAALTLVQIDLDGDKVADFRIAIDGNHTASAGNLYTGAGDTDGGWIF